MRDGRLGARRWHLCRSIFCEPHLHAELFAEQDDAPEPSVAARRIGRIEDAIRATTPNYDYYYLCPELRRKHMIPVLNRLRVKSLEEFGKRVHHSGEEYIHVPEGRAEVHTEFYDPMILESGLSVYIDSNMGHAYIAAEGCEEVLLLGVCSSTDEQLMESLITLHGDEIAAQRTQQQHQVGPASASSLKSQDHVEAYLLHGKQANKFTRVGFEWQAVRSRFTLFVGQLFQRPGNRGIVRLG